ncbi:PGF-CTERM-anchored ABC transporter substrate-binding protein [Halobellus inordinatus]|uniref:PGF-CTERM-anchored ABC transporter substrate-binding protein n=1 Tax=Halobellus inordinatus TaxID=1126236 RepID=UPI002113BE24|nr:PGF-CTERM-anchored ABC transporter substrate-binding protein [Halobellus ramosii]
MQFRVLVLAVLLVVAAAGPASGVAAGATPTAVGDASHTGPSVTCSFPYTATDATGTEVTLDADPERIVTLNPSAAQTMWEIGARDEVVGFSQYATYLEGAGSGDRVNVSGAGGPSVEKVLAADPDLVLVPNSTYGFAADRVEQIRDQGVPVFVFGQPTSLAAVANKTERIGRLTGNCEGGVERADEMRQSIALMEQALEDEDRPLALNVFHGYTSGANTFIGDVMESAGVRNGAAEAGITGFQMINDETVVELDPQWIVAPEDSPIPENEAYNSTRAIQEGNVVRVNTNYLQQPAPRSVRAAETILEAVHPDAYEEYQTLQSQAETSTTEAATTEAATTTTTAETDAPATTSTDSPGFGLSVSVVALAAAALLALRR